MRTADSIKQSQQIERIGINHIEQTLPTMQLNKTQLPKKKVPLHLEISEHFFKQSIGQRRSHNRIFLKTCLELNDDKNTTWQNLWDAAKVILKENL